MSRKQVILSSKLLEHNVECGENYIDDKYNVYEAIYDAMDIYSDIVNNSMLSKINKIKSDILILKLALNDNINNPNYEKNKQYGKEVIEQALKDLDELTKHS